MVDGVYFSKIASAIPGQFIISATPRPPVRPGDEEDDDIVTPAVNADNGTAMNSSISDAADQQTATEQSSVASANSGDDDVDADDDDAINNRLVEATRFNDFANLAQKQVRQEVCW